MVLVVLAQAAAVVAPQQGVISYPASFFTAQAPANAAEMVNRIPGFNLDTGASVRGYEGAAGNVLIDGQRPASKTDDLESILRRLPTSRVERIDVIRGGAPGIDMQGKTVIANIVRKTGGGFRGLIAGSQNHAWDGRTVGAGRIEGSGDWGRRKWEFGFLSGKGIDDGSTNGVGLSIDPAGVRKPFAIRSEGDGLNGQLTGALETPAFGGSARINGRLASEKFKFEETDTPFGVKVVEDQTSEVNQTHDTEIGVNFDRNLGPKAKLELVGLRQTHGADIESDFASTPDEAQFQLRRRGSERIARGVLKYTFNSRFSSEVGAENALNRLHSGAQLRVDRAPVLLPAANVRIQEDRSEVFAKSAWRPRDGWTVDASLRYETSKISSSGDVVLGKTLNFLKPRLTMAWAPAPSTQVRLRLEREVGQLNFDDFVATANLNNATGVSAGNPDLNPERAWVGEIALEQRFWKSGSVTVTARRFELSDVIDRGPVVAANGTVFDRPANIGSGTKDELVVDFSLPMGPLGVDNATLRGSLTKRWSKVTDPTVRDVREISGLRPLLWNANFTHDLPAQHLSYGFDAYGAFRETSYRFNLVDTFKLRTFVHPFVEWRPAPDLNIRMELPNITARGLHRTQVVYPGLRSQAGRASLEDREYVGGRMIYFRVRKTFGG